MHYSIRHLTRFRYSEPIRESIMEVRMQPLSVSPQALLDFHLTTSPRAQIFAYTDDWANSVYHFDIPGEHSELIIEASSRVDLGDLPPVPDAVSPQCWQALDPNHLDLETFLFLQPSAMAFSPEALARFLESHAIAPAEDPLSSVQRLNRRLFEILDYDTDITQVHSPITEALVEGKGVCQDFAHIMIAILRGWGVPARYVSGYLGGEAGADRAAHDVSHAWVEALIPSVGWVGFDPTNNCLARERHIRVALGRDYGDVPPTRGIFKGMAMSELAVAVSVHESERPAAPAPFLRVLSPMAPAPRFEPDAPLAGVNGAGAVSQQQQQQ